MNHSMDAFLSALYLQTTDSIIFVDVEDIIWAVNPQAVRYFGYQEQELIGEKIELLIPEYLQKKQLLLRARYQTTQRSMDEMQRLQARHKSGALLDVDIVFCSLNTATGDSAMAILIRDVHLYRLAQQKLIDMSYHDPLTGLVTGQYLIKAMPDILHASQQKTTYVACCVMDIDHFKQINDTYGHDVGDKILKHIAQRLSYVTRKNDVLARFGGDEFVILLRHIRHIEHLKFLIEKIYLSLVGQPYHVGHHQLKIAISMGISVFPIDGKNSKTLFRKADSAMYFIKNHGGNFYGFTMDLKAKRTQQKYSDAFLSIHDENRVLELIEGYLTFRGFMAYLDKIIMKHRTTPQYYLLIGIDNFKLINNTVGYEIADQLLYHIAERIKDTLLGQQCILAYKSSDEFIVLLSNYSKRQIVRIARLLLGAIAAPFRIAPHTFCITASIGISCYPLDASDRHILLTHADMALQHAKSVGKNTFKFFSLRDEPKVRWKQTLQRDLLFALDRKELFVCYQPQYDIIHHQIIGAEALLRWRHPVYGVIEPQEFIPLIENTTLLNIISDWLLVEACTKAKYWQTFIADFQMGVNVSVSQLTSLFARGNYKITTSVKKALQVSKLPPESLELEITESLVLNRELTKKNLDKLKKLNVRLACDDFGVSFSSFYRLKDLSLSTIKIDKYLTKEILKHRVEYLLIESILNIARALQIRVVVEGVTSQYQVDKLIQLGCQFAQGYFYSRPLDTKKFERLLKKQCTVRSQDS